MQSILFDVAQIFCVSKDQNISWMTDLNLSHGQNIKMLFNHDATVINHNNPYFT